MRFLAPATIPTGMEMEFCKFFLDEFVGGVWWSGFWPEVVRDFLYLRHFQGLNMTAKDFQSFGWRLFIED